MKKTSTAKALNLSALLLSLSACVFVSPPTNEDTLTDADLIRAAQQSRHQPKARSSGSLACITVSKWSNPFNVQTSVRRIPCA